METKEMLIIYGLLLLLTTMAVIFKRTHWSGILGVAIFPIYFLWIIIDVLRSPVDKAKKNNQNK
jgi:uncharacterized membrane protein YhaH (DUF805 family)